MLFFQFIIYKQINKQKLINFKKGMKKARCSERKKETNKQKSGKRREKQRKRKEIEERSKDA